jgi:hypothetical protein
MASTTSKTGNAKGGKQPKAARAATPWGAANVIERLSVPQRAGERRFASFVELLETGDGERLVRFAYSTDGVGRRGPVTLRARDVERLHKALGRTPALAAVLGFVLGDATLGEATLGEATLGQAIPRGGA